MICRHLLLCIFVWGCGDGYSREFKDWHVSLDDLPGRYVERVMDSKFHWVSGHTGDIDALVNVFWLAQEEPEVLHNLRLLRWQMSFSVDNDMVNAVVKGRGDREGVLTFSIRRRPGGWFVSAIEMSSSMQERALASRQNVRDDWREQAESLRDSTEIAFALVQRLADATERGDFFEVASLATNVRSVSIFAQLKEYSPPFYEALLKWDTTFISVPEDSSSDLFCLTHRLPEKYSSYPPDAYLYYAFTLVDGVWLLDTGPGPGYHVLW